MDELGDRMKMYEKNNVLNIFPKKIPVIARIDGRCFSKFTKGMDRPYDSRMITYMQNTAKFLLEETGALISYTQSDEITLIWYCDDSKSEYWFGGKMQKMVSQLAALATMKFNEQLWLTDLDLARKQPTFDTRVWFVPNKIEACNALLWRERDAIKNSISMAARVFYSDKELFKKTSNEKQEMLFQKGVNWNNYPAAFKRGTLFKRKKIFREFTSSELQNLPEKHEARLNPNLKFERTDIVKIDEEFGKMTDKIHFVFENGN